ncbi:thioredoxin-like protein [Gilbertella persicaria]|uniref:thioredoxin-like protein n=1 Tax=Gilbertella persicaria TaxID=101096 RepID=UPI002220BC23|nr:thioredoxin-like protein [Gilbertella persicaria]KAI8087996.1 thioredoxin-like protein [Gilbertella persicaria]
MSSLPLTVQDDIEAKEKYAAQQRQTSRKCSSRRIRVLFIIGILSLLTMILVRYTGSNDTSMIVGDELDITTQEEQTKTEPISLLEEIKGLIEQHRLIVFSKTYCPYSRKAKQLLNTYDLKEPLTVIEVDLRDDDYQVKMVLKQISGRDTFPNIFLNNHTLGGSDDLEILHETGQLTALLIQNHLLS